MHLLAINFLCAIAVAATGNGSRTLLNPNIFLDESIMWSDMYGFDDFVVLCREARIPCGEEKDESDSFSMGERSFPKQIRTTRREILNAIVARYPSYHWKVVDGVLLMGFDKSRQARKLQARISSFKANDITLDAAVYQLGKQIGIAVPPRAIATTSSIAAANSMLKKISVKLSDKTSEQVLSSLVATHQHAMWLLIHRKDSSDSKNSLYLEVDTY